MIPHNGDGFLSRVWHNGDWSMGHVWLANATECEEVERMPKRQKSSRKGAANVDPLNSIDWIGTLKI